MSKRPVPKQNLARPKVGGAPVMRCAGCTWRGASQQMLAKAQAADPEATPQNFNGYMLAKNQGALIALAFIGGRQVSAFPLDVYQVESFCEMLLGGAKAYIEELESEASAPAPALEELDFSGDVPEETREAVRRMVAAQIEQQNGAPVHVELGEFHQSDFAKRLAAAEDAQWDADSRVSQALEGQS